MILYLQNLAAESPKHLAMCIQFFLMLNIACVISLYLDQKKYYKVMCLLIGLNNIILVLNYNE